MCESYVVLCNFNYISVDMHAVVRLWLCSWLLVIYLARYLCVSYSLSLCCDVR